jgi:hypothetical protein
VWRGCSLFLIQLPEANFDEREREREREFVHVQEGFL